MGSHRDLRATDMRTRILRLSEQCESQISVGNLQAEYSGGAMGVGEDTFSLY